MKLWWWSVLLIGAAWAGPDGPPFYDPARGIEKQTNAAKDAVDETTGGKNLAKTLEHLVSVSAYVRDAMIEDMVETYDEDALLQLASQLDSSDPFISGQIAEVLGTRALASARSPLEKALKRQRNEEAASEIAWALGQIGDQASAEELLKAADKWDKKSFRVAGDAFLSAALCDPDNAAEHLKAGVDTKLAGTRIVCLAALLEVDEGAALQLSMEQMDDRQQKGWEERVMFQILENLRNVENRGRHSDLYWTAVDKLVGMLDDADGRLAHEIGTTLRSITGERDMPDDAELWEGWWDIAKDSFEPAGRPTTGDAGGDGGTTTVRYFGIPIYSKRLTFLLDLSGGMDRPVGGNDASGPPRLQVAKDELTATLQSLPEDALGNVIFFATEYFPFYSELIPVQKSLRKLLPFIMEQEIPTTVHMNRGNLYDPITTACLQESVDTLYLVTEGNPTEGRFLDRERFVRHMMRTVRFTKTEINSLFIGSASSARTYLRAVSEPTGGQFYDVAELREEEGR